MAFSTILTIVILGYVLLYIGMIVYDLFFKKSVEDLIPRQEDEDVDISDEARQFQPVVIEREVKPGDRKKENSLPVVQPEDDTVISETDKTTSNVGFDDSESTKRKPLGDIDIGKAQEKGNSKTELTPEEKRRLASMERDKAAILEKFNQSPQNQSENKIENKNTDEEKADETNEPQLKQAESSPKSRKRYESAKEQMPLPKYAHKASEFNPTVRINPDAALTKHTGGQTVEHLEKEVQSTFDDKIAMAKKEIEAGWKIFMESSPKVADEDIIKRPSNGDDSPPQKASTFSPSQ